MRHKNRLLGLLALTAVSGLGLQKLDYAPTRAQTIGQPQSSQEAVKLEILGIKLETDISGGMLGDAARPVDPTKTKFVVLTVRFPRGQGYSTKELVVQYSLLGKAQKEECGGYAPVQGGWMFVRRDRGMSSLDFYPGGEGTIDMRLLFAVPNEVPQVTFSFKGSVVGKPIDLPLK
jgi:hypothetical protein